MVNGLSMKRFSLILGAFLLLTGLGACSDLRVDTDLLTGAWVQVRAARIDDGAATYWVFQTDAQKAEQQNLGEVHDLHRKLHRRRLFLYCQRKNPGTPAAHVQFGAL